MITQKELKQLLDYDKMTGLFTWRVQKGYIKPGRIAGVVNNKNKPYIRITINQKRYMAHRLAWLYEFGYEPKEIDHINGIKYDNRIDNLREVTRSINMQNTKSIKSYSDVCGVYYDKSRDHYTIKLYIKPGHKKYFGVFKDLTEAENRCIELRRKLYPGNTL